LFYEFSLEDHMLRMIEWFVGLFGIRAHLRSHYNDIG